MEYTPDLYARRAEDARQPPQGEDGNLPRTYYLKPNQPVQGAHVRNCGYIVGKKRAAKGSPQDFRAMQFNLVVSTNEDAIRLWQKLSFEIIGTLPGTFHHPRLGSVDAFVMCKQLAT